MNHKTLSEKLSDLNKALTTHQLYQKLNSIDKVQYFMEQHLYAVWDFMSLLKTLQQQLTATKVPWFPVENPKTARLINEIVLGEETDIDQNGNPISHFDLYKQAMVAIGASTTEFDSFQQHWDYNTSAVENIENASIHPAVKKFLNFTFEVIATDKPHIVAAVFTFGRETIIPEMFLEIVNSLKENTNDEQDLSKLIYYLERHIELDGDEHGPMAFEMISMLCGDDHDKWNDVVFYAQKAIEHRIQLWDSICDQL